MKEEIPKFFGFIVTKEVKSKIIKSLSKFQIGAVPGHRPQEHLFALRSIISLFKFRKKPLFLSFYDISKFFDKELLEDALDAVYCSGIKGKLYRLLYLMNKDAKIRIKTGVGLTREADSGDNVAQGTVEGATISAKNIDKDLDEKFSQSYHEISYGNLNLQPLLFQDDVMRASESIESLIFGNQIIDHIMKEKVLELNTDKSNYMLIGEDKVTIEIRKELSQRVIRLGGQPIKESKSEKYLGDHIHNLGNNQSIIETVRKRYGKAMEAVMDIKCVVEDVRGDYIGAIETGIKIFEK